MKRAIALAIQGKQNGNGAFGAVIVRNGAMVAEGHNTVSDSTDCTQHAELSVIQKACKIRESKVLDDCVLYTSCEPCMMCLGACYWAKFKAIYYGASAEDAKEYGFVYSNMYYTYNKDNRRKEFNLKQLLRDEAVAVWLD